MSLILCNSYDCEAFTPLLIHFRDERFTSAWLSQGIRLLRCCPISELDLGVFTWVAFILVSINTSIFRIGSEDVPNFIISELKNELKISRHVYLVLWVYVYATCFSVINEWMRCVSLFFFKLLHVVDSLIMRKYDLWLTSDCNMKRSLRSLCASMMRLKLHILRVVFF